MTSEQVYCPPGAHALAKPEDLLDTFAIASTTTYFYVQALVNPNGTRSVFRIGRHRAMAHPHELDLLKLRQFFRVGRNLARSSSNSGSSVAGRRASIGEVLGQ
jgi:hypothetical protein